MRSSSSSNRRPGLPALTVLAALLLSTQSPVQALATEADVKSNVSTEAPAPAAAQEAVQASEPEALSPEIASLYEKYGGYCDAIVDAAREQRYAMKRSEIEQMSKELQKQLELADAKSSALEKWVKRREEFAKQASAKIVEIYANMRPEASAARLQQLDINLAASLLLAIPPRQASPILNEMDEKNAAAITAVMAASARLDDPS